MTSAGATPVETILRDELTRADRALDSVGPVLGHMLASPGPSLVSEAIVARVRGMLDDLAAQLHQLLSGKGGPAKAPSSQATQRLSDRLANNQTILDFLHSAAIESQIALQLERQAGVEPVLSPLWQELIGSDDPAKAETAMQGLTAQSRFMQTTQRMQFPLHDLPAPVLEQALRTGVRATPTEEEGAVTDALRSFKANYDEAGTRDGLLARIVSSMGQGAIAALELDHGGLALFATALAQLSGQDRIRAVLSCHDQQAARLVLGLRAANMDDVAIERQFRKLDPASRLPRGLTTLSTEAARALLGNSSPTQTVHETA